MENVTENPMPSIGIRIENFLKSRYHFRVNTITAKPEFKELSEDKYTEISDYEVNSFFRLLEMNGIKCSVKTLYDRLYSNFADPYNPMTDYLKHLPQWDIQDPDYIDQLASTIKTTDDDFWKKYFKKWFVAMVASLLNDNVVNHTMLILIGYQGVGKTTWTTGLVPKSLKKYCYTGTIDPTSKDTLIYLAECMLIIMDELENLNKKQKGSVKELITKPSIKVRRPFKHFAENLPHRASFIGSINDSDFLYDTSGNRRFLCNVVRSIDNAHKIDLDKVYAQAVALFYSGFQYWLSPEENAEVSERNEEFRNRSVEEETLNILFEPAEDTPDSIFMTNTQILSHLSQQVKININQGSKQRLAYALDHAGFIRTKRNERYGYLVRWKSQLAQNSLNRDNLKDQSAA